MAFAISAPAITENGVSLSGYGTLSYEYKLKSASAWTNGLPKNAGVYDVKATFTGNANVTGGTATNTVTIGKAPLTVAANNITKVVGTENPTLTIAYGGFVNNEDASVLTALPAASTTATKLSDIGEYPITVSGGSAANYSFVYVPGILTVSPLPAAQAPAFTQNLSGEYIFYNHVFNCNLKVAASVSDNGVITYQWYRNTVNSTSGGSPIAGATEDSYAVPTDTQGTVYFYAVATNTLDISRTASAASNTVKVTVNPPEDPGPAASPSPTASRSPGAAATQSPGPSAAPSPGPTAAGSSPRPESTPMPSEAPNNGGNIKLAVLPETQDTPEITVSNSAELRDMVLTPEDKDALQNGENITITLKVVRVEAPVNQGDDARVMDSMGGNKLGMYLDVELIKQIGERLQNITNTSRPIRIVLAVPPELQKEDRNYSIIRVHGDETTILPDLDNDPATITIETDRFSTYALVYKDRPEISFWLILIICILVIAFIIVRIYAAGRKRKKHSG